MHFDRIERQADGFFEAKRRDEDSESDRREAIAEALEAEALRLAEQIVRDADRLHGCIERDEIRPHEIRMLDGAYVRSVERVVYGAVSSSLVDPRNGLAPVANELVRALASTPEVLTRAERAVLSEYSK